MSRHDKGSSEEAMLSHLQERRCSPTEGIPLGNSHPTWFHGKETSLKLLRNQYHSNLGANHSASCSPSAHIRVVSWLEKLGVGDGAKLPFRKAAYEKILALCGMKTRCCGHQEPFYWGTFPPFQRQIPQAQPRTSPLIPPPPASLPECPGFGMSLLPLISSPAASPLK